MICIFAEFIEFSHFIQVFVWGFWGAQTNWRAPVGNRYFDELVRTGRFEGTMAGRDKDAADFAIVRSMICPGRGLRIASSRER